MKNLETISPDLCSVYSNGKAVLVLKPFWKELLNIYSALLTKILLITMDTLSQDKHWVPPQVLLYGAVPPSYKLVYNSIK